MKEWKTGDVIAADDMNRIEMGSLPVVEFPYVDGEMIVRPGWNELANITSDTYACIVRKSENGALITDGVYDIEFGVEEEDDDGNVWKNIILLKTYLEAQETSATIFMHGYIVKHCDDLGKTEINERDQSVRLQVKQSA